MSIKCPICGAWALVTETRTRKTNIVARRYRCKHDHRFTTHEEVVPDDTEQHEALRLEIGRAAGSVSDVAQRYRVSESTVKRHRAYVKTL